MTLIESVLLGVVEGVTEFLPISSTGHLVLASHALGIAHTPFLSTFEVVIQLGAMLAVVFLYWRQFLDSEILKRLVIAFIPTGIAGLFLYQTVKQFLGNEMIVLWALALGGVVLILFEWWHKEPHDAHEDIRTMPYHTAALIGVFQILAMIPGVSRSGATIVGGLFMGLRRTTIVEFSFLLAVPTILAASGLDLVTNASHFSQSELIALTAGFASAAVVAYVSIVWLLQFVRHHSFIPFGIYRIALAILFFLLIIR